MSGAASACGNSPARTIAAINTTTMHIRSVLGASIFWTTPIGPLRFDFTRAIQKESYDKVQNFNFTISTKF